MKDFDSWNNFKKQLESKQHGAYLKEREVWFAAVGLNVGYEEDGKNNNFERPILIIKKFNQHLCIGVPFSTILKPDNRHYLSILHDNKKLSVILSQTRPFSSKRLLRRMFILDEAQVDLVKKAVAFEFFSAKKTDSTFAESSGPEGIYRISLTKDSDFVKHNSQANESQNKKTRSGGRNSSLVLPGHGDKQIVAKKLGGINPTTKGAK